jgi:outer membrane lipoprotein SlyB
MQHLLLLAGLSALLMLGCAAHPQLPANAESTEASTTAAIFIRSGYVIDVRDVTVHDNASAPSAPVVGALLGGIAGSLIGRGGGRTLAAIGGAAGGSVAAQELTKPGKTQLKKVTVRFANGELQTYELGADESFQVGEAVRIVQRNGKIHLTR